MLRFRRLASHKNSSIISDFFGEGNEIKDAKQSLDIFDFLEELGLLEAIRGN